MAEMTKRPKIRQVEVEITESGEKRKVRGPDLNDVLRGVVIDLRNAWGLSTRALSQRLGIRQQTLAGFIDEDLDQGTRVEMLTKICASLDMSPAELFALHPEFEDAGTDRAWMMIRNSLSDEGVEQLIEAVLVGHRLGVLPGFVSNLNEMVAGLARVQGVDTTAARREAKTMAKG